MKKIAVSDVVDKDVNLAAVISKLIKSKTDSQNQVSNLTDVGLLSGGAGLHEVSASLIQELKDVRNIFNLFPDLELASKILISNVLSPKDMGATTLTLGVEETIVSSTVTNLMLDVLNELLTEMKLVKELPEILKEALVTHGAYVKIVIPENSLDDLINGNEKVSLEAFNKTDLFLPDGNLQPLGFFGGKKQDKVKSFGLESIEGFDLDKQNPTDRLNIEITDNFNILSLPNLLEQQTNIKMEELINKRRFNRGQKPGFESNTSIFKESTTGYDNYIKIKKANQGSRKPVSKPLIQKSPFESFIPVCLPTDKTKRVGGFILVNEEGYPITMNDNLRYSTAFDQAVANSTSGVLARLTEQARRNMNSSDTNQYLRLSMARAYGKILEEEIEENIKSGILQHSAYVNINDDILNIMLARSYANKLTRLVFVPEPLVTYFAFDYRDDGIGLSIISGLRTIAALRSALMFIKVVAQVKNSMMITKIDATLDPKSPDPRKDMELIVEEVVAVRQQSIPIGLFRANDLSDWTTRAGLEFTFKGHPKLPQTTLETEYKTPQHNIGDDNTEDGFRKSMYMRFGLNPEQIDAANGADFAATVESNNLLFAQRMSDIQDQFTPQIVEHIVKVFKNYPLYEERMLTRLRENKEVIRKLLDDENKTKMNENEDNYFYELIQSLLSNLKCSLPRAETASNKIMYEMFQTEVDAIDSVLNNAFLPDELTNSDMLGDIGGKLMNLKAIVKSYYLRDWLTKNGVMSNLNDLVTKNDEGKPTLDLYQEMSQYVEGLIHSCVKYVNTVKPMADAGTKDMENITGQIEEPVEETSDDTGEESMDDGMGDDMDAEPIEEEPTETETEEEPTEDDSV